MTDIPQSGDRRQNPAPAGTLRSGLRTHRPFYDSGRTWGGRPLNGLAFHTLRDRMPELSEEEAHIVVIALARAFEERRR